MEILLLILTLHTGLNPVGQTNEYDIYDESHFDSYAEVMITNEFYFTALRTSIDIPFIEIPNDEFNPEVKLMFTAGIDTDNFKIGVEQHFTFLSFSESVREYYIYIDVKGTFDLSGLLK